MSNDDPLMAVKAMRRAAARQQAEEEEPRAAEAGASSSPLAVQREALTAPTNTGSAALDEIAFALRALSRLTLAVAPATPAVATLAGVASEVVRALAIAYHEVASGRMTPAQAEDVAAAWAAMRPEFRDAAERWRQAPGPTP